MSEKTIVLIVLIVGIPLSVIIKWKEGRAAARGFKRLPSLKRETLTWCASVAIVLALFSLITVIPGIVSLWLKVVIIYLLIGETPRRISYYYHKKKLAKSEKDQPGESGRRFPGIWLP